MGLQIYSSFWFRQAKNCPKPPFFAFFAEPVEAFSKFHFLKIINIMLNCIYRNPSLSFIKTTIILNYQLSIYQLSINFQLYTLNSQLKNTHGYHRTSLRIRHRIMMVPCQVVTEMFRHGLQLVVLQLRHEQFRP